MDGIMEDFLSSLISESASTMNSMYSDIMNLTMYVEKYIAEAIDSNAVVNIYQFIYLLFLSLLALKVLKKGFFVYILWRDGDADTSPKESVIAIFLAITTAAMFPLLYDYLAEIIFWLTETLVNLVFSLDPSSSGGIIDIIGSIPNGLVAVIMHFVYLLCLVLLWFQILRRSIEMLILRMAFPLACIGLIDSDSGVFKPYVRLLMQSSLTIVIQVVCFNLSRLLTQNLNGIFAIGAILVAINGPQLLSSLLVHTGGTGNPGQKVHQSITILNAARALGRGK